MSSNATPPNNTDDEWPLDDKASGRWEEDAPKARPAARRSAKRPAKDAGAKSLLSDPAAIPLLAVGGIALLGMCGLACLALVLFAVGGPGAGGLSGILGRSSADATPSAGIVPTAPISVTMADRVGVNGTPVPPAIPARLTIGAKAFDVRDIGINDEKELKYDPNDKRTAYWLAGTLVNYVIGLHSSTDNKALYESIQVNDLISIDTAVGPQRYRVVSKTKTEAENLQLISDQSSPRVTLVMFGSSSDERDVLIAQYTDEGTPNQTVPLGAPVNLGDVRVTTTDYRLIPGGSVGLSEGRNLMQINLRVTSNITRIIDAAQFYTELGDGQGNKYQLSMPGAAAGGANGWAKGALQPGQTITLTAAFEVPNAMQGPYLEWRFATDPQNAYVARVAIGYQPRFVEPTAQPTAAPRIKIDIIDASITPEGTEVAIVGSITNLTQDVITINQQTIALKAADGSQLPMNEQLPALPWEIPPNGAPLTFKLKFVKPPAFPVTFTVLEQSVQISDR
jgi:hypothetical protein